MADSIINEIRTLPAAKLVKLLRHLNEIDPEGAYRRRQERNAILEQTAGSMARLEGEAFEKAIQDAQNGH
ncbi:MAG: hypothetical protein ACKVHP_18755 [Verrucomicrobiales bacterium]